MKTRINEDWCVIEVPITVGFANYEVTAYVYLSEREVPEDYHWPPYRIETTAELETWESTPRCPKEHEAILERKLKEEIAEWNWD